MNQANITFWLSVLGAVTGTVLALMKAFEFYRGQRAVVKADVRLTTHEEIGNTIVLLNKSSIPITLSYFELAWVERRKIGRLRSDCP